MKKILGPDVSTTWEERFDARKEAIQAAAQVYQGKGDYKTHEYAIINLANTFEKWLMDEL